jgi:hypothetical protein
MAAADKVAARSLPNNTRSDYDDIHDE